MSLIPSESLNFPDSFRANVGWHLDEDPDAPPPSFPSTEMAEQKTDDAPKTPEHSKPAKDSKERVDTPAPAPSKPEPVAAAPAPAETSRAEADPPSGVIPPEPAMTELSAQEGTIDMSALFKYFLASGAATIVPEKPNDPVNIQPLELSPSSLTTPDRAGHAASLPNGSEMSETKSIEPATMIHAEPPTPASESQVSQQPSSSLVTETVSLQPAPSATVVIDTPAQAQNILAMIAAAVQRGAIAGEAISPPETEASPQIQTRAEAPPPTERESKRLRESEAPPKPVPEPPRDFTISAVAGDTPNVSLEKSGIPNPSSGARSLPSERQEPVPPKVSAPVPSAAPLPAQQPASAEGSASSTAPAVLSPQPNLAAELVVPSAATEGAAKAPTPSTRSNEPAPETPKAPAKIRITPRKIKPRPQTSAPPEPAVSEDVVDEPDEPVERPREKRRDIAIEPVPGATFRSLESPLGPPPGTEMPPWKAAAARRQYAQADLLIFTARERRNRWIGFGLSELAARHCNEIPGPIPCFSQLPADRRLFAGPALRTVPKERNRERNSDRRGCEHQNKHQ